jgi:hypothetical protein
LPGEIASTGSEATRPCPKPMRPPQRIRRPGAARSRLTRAALRHCRRGRLPAPLRRLRLLLLHLRQPLRRQPGLPRRLPRLRLHRDQRRLPPLRLPRDQRRLPPLPLPDHRPPPGPGLHRRQPRQLHRLPRRGALARPRLRRQVEPRRRQARPPHSPLAAPHRQPHLPRRRQHLHRPERRRLEVVHRPLPIPCARLPTSLPAWLR